MTWYSVGTVAVTANSPVVSGAGTAFVANVFAGDALVIPGSNVPPIEILAVNADGQLTLARNWPGASGSGLVFTILPTQSYIHDLALQAAQLLATFATVRDTIGQGLFASGSAGAPGLRLTEDQDTGLMRVGANVLGLVAGGAVIVQVNTSGIATAGDHNLSGNFNAAGYVLGGSVVAGQTGKGTVTLADGGTTGSGIAYFYAPDHSTLLGYIGAISSAGGHIQYRNQNGAYGHSFTRRRGAERRQQLRPWQEQPALGLCGRSVEFDRHLGRDYQDVARRPDGRRACRSQGHCGSDRRLSVERTR